MKLPPAHDEGQDEGPIVKGKKAHGRPARPPWSPPWIVLVALLSVVACSSPNRGYWSGDFDGSVAGVVDFTINARGTKIKGKMVGKTRNGEDFRATLEGILRQDYINADFEGTSQSGYGVPLRFEGTMTGSLDSGLGKGEWTARIKVTDLTLKGGWSVTQVEP